MVKWSRAADKAGVIGIFLVLGVLGISILTMMDTQNQIVALNGLVNGTQEQVSALNGLISATQNQTAALETTVREIQHLTYVNAYVNGAPFEVEFKSCSQGTKTFPNGTSIEYISTNPRMISNSTGVGTIVPFYGFFEFEYYGVNSGWKEKLHYLGTDRFKSYVIDSANYHAFPNLIPKEFFEKARNEGYDKVSIKIEYDFRPYSPVKEGVALDDQLLIDRERWFAFVKLYEDGSWHVMDKRDEAICRS